MSASSRWMAGLCLGLGMIGFGSLADTSATGWSGRLWAQDKASAAKPATGKPVTAKLPEKTASTAAEKSAGEKSAADKVAPVLPGQPVVLTRCRIKLIDEVVMAAGRSGILSFVEPVEGDAVKKDQEVAGLMDEVARANLAVAEYEAKNDIEIRYAQKAHEVAVVEWQRAIEANSKVPNTFPDVDVKKLKLAAEKAELQIEQARHGHKIHQLKRDEASEVAKQFRVRAPFEGVVTKVYRAKGEAVREGDPILELCSTAKVRVEGYLPIAALYRVQQGAPVQVQLDLPDADLPEEKETFDGRLVFVDVRAQPITGEFRVWAEVINRKNLLRAGLTAKMTVLPMPETAQAKPAEGK